MCPHYGFFSKMPVRWAPWAKKVSGVRAHAPSVTGTKRARVRTRARARKRERERERDIYICVCIHTYIHTERETDRQTDRRERTPRRETPQSGHSKKITNKRLRKTIIRELFPKLRKRTLRQKLFSGSCLQSITN